MGIIFNLWPIGKAHVPLRSTVPFASRILRAGLYGATVFISFFLMLVFMTYNVGGLPLSGLLFFEFILLGLSYCRDCRWSCNWPLHLPV